MIQDIDFLQILAERLGEDFIYQYSPTAFDNSRDVSFIATCEDDDYYASIEGRASIDIKHDPGSYDLPPFDTAEIVSMSIKRGTLIMGGRLRDLPEGVYFRFERYVKANISA